MLVKFLVSEILEVGIFGAAEVIVVARGGWWMPRSVQLLIEAGNA